MNNNVTPASLWRQACSALKTVSDLIGPFKTVFGAGLGAGLSALGLNGADTPEFKFAMLTALVMFGLTFVILAALSLPIVPKRVQGSSHFVLAFMVLVTVGLGVEAYRTTYESRAVDRLA